MKNSKGISADLIASMETVYPQGRQYTALEIGSTIEFDFSYLDFDKMTHIELREAIIHESEGRSLKFGTVLGWLVEEGTELSANPNKKSEYDELLMFNSKRKSLHEYLKEHQLGLPESVIILKKVATGSNKKYLEGDQGALRTQMYEHFGISTDFDKFPTVAARNVSKDLTDPNNYSVRMSTFVELPSA